MERNFPQMPFQGKFLRLPIILLQILCTGTDLHIPVHTQSGARYFVLPVLPSGKIAVRPAVHIRITGMYTAAPHVSPCLCPDKRHIGHNFASVIIGFKTRLSVADAAGIPGHMDVKAVKTGVFAVNRSKRLKRGCIKGQITA